MALRKAFAENKNAIVASCWTYFTTIKHDARNSNIKFSYLICFAYWKIFVANKVTIFFLLTLTIFKLLLAVAHIYAKLSLALVTMEWRVFGTADLAYCFRRRTWTANNFIFNNVLDGWKGMILQLYWWVVNHPLPSLRSTLWNVTQSTFLWVVNYFCKLSKTACWEMYIDLLK